MTAAPAIKLGVVKTAPIVTLGAVRVMAAVAVRVITGEFRLIDAGVIVIVLIPTGEG